MKRLTTVALLIAILVLPAAALTGAEILDKVEAVLTGFDDMTATYKITVTDSDGTNESSEMKMWALGDEKRMVKYTSPASVKGIGFLVLSEDEMYFYSPSRSDVRRIAGHALEEGFHNTDFSYDDMSGYNYSDDYTAKLLGEDDGKYKIKLTPKSGADTAYTKLIMWVDPDTWVFTRVDFYEASGCVKRLTTGSVKVRNGYMTIGALLMKDLETGHKSKLSITSIDYDTDLSTSFFSQRQLKR